MNKNLLPKYFLVLVFVVFSVSSFAQAMGDFQSRTSGNWSDFNSWNVYNGTFWVAAVSGQLPATTSNVYIRASHIISVDNSTAVCNDLNIDNGNGAKIAFTAMASVLNAKGNLAFIPASTANCFGTWMSGGKIVFSGNGNQTLPNNLGSFSVLDLIEVNKSSGTLTTGNSIKFNTFTLTAGNFDVAPAADIRGNSGTASININGGTWTQIFGTTTISSSSSSIGPLTINGGSMVLETTTGTVGFQFSTIDVTNGGTLTLNPFNGLINISNSINVSAGSFFNTALTTTLPPPTVNLVGTVNYNRAGNQTIIPATYNYLKISGTGTKTLGGSTTIPNNATLEMSGVATSPTLSLGPGTLSVSSTGSNLIYSSTGSQAASANEWDPNFQNVTINNTSSTGVGMTGLSRTISGSLNLNNGNFDIGANGYLTLNGSSLNRINGFLKATPTSDLIVTGIAGGTVLLPLATNISLRNITISGTRTLAMDGINNIDLYGTLNIGATATYDNGGESQIQKGTNATPSIIIDGKFLNRDKDDFANTNGAISASINPTLNSTSIIEFGRSSDQFFSARTDYRNITFSGSGIKTPSSTFIPNGTLAITGTAILDASTHNISDGSTATNFTMDGGRLILGTTGTQPMMNGLYNLTGGVVQFNNSSGTAQTIRSLKNYYKIEVTGNNVGNSNGNINLNPNGSFTVKTNGIFMINADAIVGTNGTESVTVENGAIFKCGNNEGFNGFASTPPPQRSSSIHQNIQMINLMPGSTVEYTGTGLQPITNFNGLVYQNLLLSGSGNKIAPIGILTIQGNLTKSGTSVFVPGGGTVLFNGTAAQSFVGLTYNNLLLTNNTKTTQGSSTILDSLKVNVSTTLDVSAADTIIIHSDSTKTARVAKVDGSITNTSRFTVERFIPSRRAWRFLSVPTSSSQTIKNAWQEGALMLSSNPKPGYGTQIQSTAVNWNTTGFDAQSINGPSIKTYDYLTDTYTRVASLLNSFNVGLGGYMTFIRGDRTATYFGAPVTQTVLRTTGNLFTGNQPAINVLSGRIIPVNNPYASSLDLRKLSSSYNIFYYVWDPNRGGGFGFGAFQTLSWNGSGYDVVPGGGSYGATNNFIESGQAFFASTLGFDTTVQITESAKVSTTPVVIPFVPASNPMSLRLNLYTVNTDGATVLSDGTLTSFANNYNDQIDGMDAKKLFNNAENLSIKSHSEFLTIERKPLLNANDTIFLDIRGPRLNQYRLEMIADNLVQSGYTAYLEDAYLNKRDQLDMNGTTLADFDVDLNPASAVADRFRIVFEAPAGGPLPVTLTNVKAYKKNENISVEWTAYNESGVVQYDIEKSAEGNSFEYVATHTANNTSYNVYTWLDGNAFAGYNYYRIKIIYANGEITYSKIVKALMPEIISSIKVYPNPVKDGIINLQFLNQAGGLYQLKLVNKLGQIILIKEINHATRSTIEKISIENRKVAHGIYNLEIIGPDASKISTKILY